MAIHCFARSLTNSMKKLSSILKTLMAELNMNESELARRTGIGQPVIHRICSGETDNPKVATLSPIANFFAISISQLIGDEPLPTHRIPGTFNPGVQGWCQVPWLAWTQILLWPNAINNLESLPSVAVDLDLSQYAYAVTMHDNTMEPRFMRGTLLIMEPNLHPSNGDFVMVHVGSEAIPSFKQLLIDGVYYHLKSLNPDFKTRVLRKPYRFLGVMVQAKMNYKEVDLISAVSDCVI